MLQLALRKAVVYRRRGSFVGLDGADLDEVVTVEVLQS
jgi:hypothetical protein